MEINGHEIRNEELFLMDITYINAEFTKNKVRQVDGVLGTGFLEMALICKRINAFLSCIAW